MNTPTHFLLRTVILIGALFCSCAQAEEKKWKVFEGCTLIENESNDGDSFHVKYKTRSYIFRLYWVDAPETDDRYPERLEEQARDMGIAVKEVMPLGRKAAAFSKKMLKQPFTVYTTYENARGASDKKRYYVMIETEAGFLSQALIENGYARLKGFQPDPPGPLSQRSYAMRLNGIARGVKPPTGAATAPTIPLRSNTLIGKTIVAKKSILIFKENPPHSPAGTVKPGTELTVIDEAAAGRVKITFNFPNGRTYTGLCLKTDLQFRTP